MHRTQITLEDDQYIVLRERARRSKKSMSQIIRELLQRELETGPKRGRGKKSGLSRMTGILQDRNFGGEDHDDALYGGR